ncbi:hypothetical protein ES703_30701 [subsurface metagenome]|nr:hypothetical protein [bacterium]
MAPDSYRKLSSKERELACSIAMDTAAELINAVCMNEGSRVVRINSDAASVSFAVPPEVMDKINGNPGVSVDEMLTIPWVKGWTEGILKMTHPDWEAYPEHKRTELTKGLVERKLLPTLKV